MFEHHRYQIPWHRCSRDLAIDINGNLSTVVINHAKYAIEYVRLQRACVPRRPDIFHEKQFQHQQKPTTAVFISHSVSEILPRKSLRIDITFRKSIYSLPSIVEWQHNCIHHHQRHRHGTIGVAGCCQLFKFRLWLRIKALEHWMLQSKYIER